jgi:hypothetical protein
LDCIQKCGQSSPRGSGTRKKRYNPQKIAKDNSGS